MPDGPPTAAGLRDRLAGLTLRDEHRLGRRLQRDRRDPERLAALTAEVVRAEARVARRRAAVPALSYPSQLPVSARREDLLAAIRDHQVVVVAGETGSGKTTQLPKLCLELGRGVRGAIAHTQPRRIAARSVAQRIADELAVPLGGAVGYSVRFNERAGEDTLVRLVTDGLLLAEVQHDRLLRRYDTIIVDEAHERSLNIDFLLGYLRELLPQRPDLKLVITSATIDPGQFAAHFGDAPVVEVSGRTFPVEVRYRPPADDDADLPEAIGDATEELLAEGDGDVLVFLSGEREIRDTAEHLTGRLGAGVEVLPLYARLSAAEQQRIFRPHGGRRVVLATNVAETSLTVPGIRYVVDPGTARISRYSARLKVQRLPIEPISQASADQRTGRCGRVAAGVCVRLFSEADFLDRPRFTDPEVVRTNLASVILQMAALGLGDVADFGFLDPPDGRQIRDGVALLHELGALDPDEPDPRRRLTPVGRRLARLPVDPRLGRMVLEADTRRCAEEVCVIAAALSVQDPRERPAEHQAQADQSHARFAVEGSDFLGFLELWRYLARLQDELSGNQFRKRCKAEFLHYLRVREWQDLAGQLRAAAERVDVSVNQAPAEPADVHRAVLAGLLSHVGLKDAGGAREFTGARGARFAIFPGSRLARRPPAWVMVAELVETSRLWGRVAAQVDPRWVEELAGHLVRRTYAEPRWDRRRGGVVATERVTLYGLPVVAGRRVAYGAIDPGLARELFLQHALVARDWDTRHAFFAENGRQLAGVAQLEDRLRRRDLLVEDRVLYDFFDARVPASVVSAAHFDRWWKDERRRHPELLTYTRRLLVRADPDELAGDEGRPATWRDGALELPLSYRFAPGSDADGVTAHVPLRALASLDAARFAWGVPAQREELVTALIRTLPKELRRPLVPVPEVARAVLAAVRPGREDLLDAVARELQRLRGVVVPRDAWRPEALPAHLRMTFRVEDDAGEAVAEGTDLSALRADAVPRLRADLAAAAAPLEREGMRRWELAGPLPRVVALPGTQGAVRAWPALVDEGDAVGVRVLDSAAAQAAAMRAGTRRLLRLGLPNPARRLRDRLGRRAQLTLATAPHGGLGAVLDDVVGAAIDALLASAGGPAWDAAAFAALRDAIAPELDAACAQVLAQVVAILDADREVQRRLDAVPANATTRGAREDVARQRGRLVFAGFATASGAERLPEVRRHLEAAARRLDRLGDMAAKDRELMALVADLDAEWAALGPDAASAPELAEVPWLLERLRSGPYAGGMGSPPHHPARTIRRLLDERRRAPNASV